MHSSSLRETSQPHVSTLEYLAPRSTVTDLSALKTEVIQALQEAKRDCEEAKLLANAEYYRVIIEKLMNPEVRLIREPRP